MSLGWRKQSCGIYGRAVVEARGRKQSEVDVEDWSPRDDGQRYVFAREGLFTLAPKARHAASEVWKRKGEEGRNVKKR